MQKYINFNGNIFKEQEPLLTVNNRGFTYGDGFFESMVMFSKRIPLFTYHWARIQYTAEVLGATLPPKLDEDSLTGMILDLAAIHNNSMNARVRIQFYRKGDGLYLPQETELGFTIQFTPIANNQFEVGEGVLAGLHEDCFKPLSLTSDLKTSSALMYVIAAEYAQAHGFEECILTDGNGFVSEAIHSNLLLVKQDKMITPDLECGCVNGVMRSYLIHEFETDIEERHIELRELLEAEEILLLNAVKGIQWVKQFELKKYTNKKAVELTAFLNHKLL